MSTNPENDTPKGSGIKRLQIGLNVLLQLVATGLLVVMANYLAFNHFKRWDCSRDRKYALSDTTRQKLGSLNKPVKAIVFFSPGVEIYDDVQNLLKEYQYASGKKLEIETVDAYRNFTRARELQAKYKFGANENIVILDCDGRTKFVSATDMADYDNSGVMYGQPPKLTAFKGEQALTAALLEITEERQNRIYVLAGHGEPDLKGDTLSSLRTYIERQNIKADPLNLMNVDAVPKDARAILILGPKYDFSEREMKLLRDYWEKRGRLFIAVDPAALTERFTAFIQEQGVKPDDDRILRTVDMGTITGVLRDVTVVFLDGNPVTKRLKGVTTQFLGGTQSLTLDQAGVKGANIRLQSLIEAAEGFWGETEYNRGDGSPVFFDPKKDKTAPLTIATSVEKGALEDAIIHVDTSRMIIIANGDFVSNDVLTEANVDFTLSSLNWLLDRGELIGIAPKPAHAFNLNLSEKELSRISLVVLVLIPGGVAVIGLAGWLKRRR